MPSTARKLGIVAPFLALFGLLFKLALPLAPPERGNGYGRAEAATASEGLPWESFHSSIEEVDRLRPILSGGKPAGAVLQELSRIAEEAEDPLARGLAELGAGIVLLEARRLNDAAQHLLSPWIDQTALSGYALHYLGRALEETNPRSALEALSRLVSEQPDFARIDEARLRLSRLLRKFGRHEESVPVLREILASPTSRSRDEALWELSQALVALGRKPEAGRALETLHYEMPASPLSDEAGRKLDSLRSVLPRRDAETSYRLSLERAERLYDERRYREALAGYIAIGRRFPRLADHAILALRRGVCEYRLGRRTTAEKTLAGVKSKEPEVQAEALYYRALAARRLGRIASYRSFLEDLLSLAPSGPWAEEALWSLASHHRLEKELETALGYYRRLSTDFREGKYSRDALWHLLWADYSRSRYEEAAAGFENAARENPASVELPQFLFWAARSYEKAGQGERARDLYRQLLLGYKNSYYGVQTQEHLARLAGQQVPEAVLAEGRRGIDLRRAIRVSREERQARIGQLVALGLFEEAALEAEQAVTGEEDDPAFLATLAWIRFQQGQYRAAIQTMRQAFPFHLSATGDLLPEEVWQILYPLKYRELVERYSREQGLDPYLVAALIHQESTFNPVVRSTAGARGLMQVLPSTGWRISREQRWRYGRQELLNPETNIRLGTYYLRQMLDRFGGRVDYALAGYNAGPHRVVAWTGMDLTLDSEKFIEEIPFSETRNYVKAVLRNKAQYQRIYGGPASVADEPGGAPSRR